MENSEENMLADVAALRVKELVSMRI